jgi:hypothetical protein
MSTRPIAVVTGASSGIGAATAEALASAGYHVWCTARRKDRIDALAEKIGGTAFVCDVADVASIDALAAALPGEVHLLVNNAGGAQGLDTVEDAKDSDWITMFETNVLGLMRVTRALLPKMKAAPKSHIVNVTSIAGREAYPKGAGYTSAKHGARVITQTLRAELNGLPIRITDISPGLVETEFSVVRFAGDTERAAKVYDGYTPLTADDIAETIRWAVMLPAHVNIDEIVVKPLAQASATQVARGAGL